MTILFLRFYLGVIGILLIALMIQSYVYSVTSADRNVAVIEEALGGGALLVRDELIRGGESQAEETMERLQSRFAYPIRVVPRSKRPMGDALYERIDRGESVLFWGMIQTSIPDTPLLVELGPLPTFARPSRVDLGLAAGAVFVLTAVAIAILLRPVVRQLRLVERTALAIAGGDLSARIDDRSRNTRQLSGAFNTMADRVEDSLRAQRELLQSVSHELRTPLSRIRFASELIRTAKNDAQRDERIDAIDSATDQLDDLVGELLTYARFDAVASPAAMAPVEVSSLIREIVQTHQPLAPGIQITNTTSDAESSVISHRRALDRAIGNLIGNACKYAKTEVAINASLNNGELLVTVDDDGHGIAPDERERVFEPFHRASQDAQPGYGLGLALVRRICRRLGGSVAASDSPLGGARLQIRLPTSLDDASGSVKNL